MILMKNPMFLDRNLSQHHSDYHKSVMDWPGITPRFHSDRVTTDCLNHTLVFSGQEQTALPIK